MSSARRDVELEAELREAREERDQLRAERDTLRARVDELLWELGRTANSEEE